jgi:sec-independent protein translocase protein TatA
MSMFITMGMVGPWQIAIIVLLVILLFGAKRIPELMRGAGRGVKEFKDAINKDYSAEDNTKSENKKLEE